MVFEDKERNSQDRKWSHETHYEFLDRSSWKSMDRIRHFVNQCWLNYPEKERSELLSRLRSREGYKSATFEMLLHESLLKTGCTLEHHPDIGASTAPDFYVKSPGGVEFIVEAVIASEVNDLKPSVEALKEQVLDRLDAKVHHDFFIEIRDSGEPTQAPRGKVFSNEVVSWLDTLDYGSLRNEFERSNFENMPCAEWELNGWELKIRPMPVSEERRGKTTSLIAFHPTRGGCVNSWEPLRDALIRKNGKYGKVNLPLIIAVNFGRFYLSDIDEIQALYGSERIFVSSDQEAKAKIMHEPNGAWMGPKGPQCTRTSGAWFFTDLNWYSAERCVQKMYINPWAIHEIPKFMRNFPTCAVCSDGSIVRNDGVSIGSILELPAGWPE